MPIYANFSTFFDAFFLPTLPIRRIFTHQPPFLTQKQGFATYNKKKNLKNHNFLENLLPKMLLLLCEIAA
jgi:hypothetical protein